MTQLSLEQHRCSRPPSVYEDKFEPEARQTRAKAKKSKPKTPPKPKANPAPTSRSRAKPVAQRRITAFEAELLDDLKTEALRRIGTWSTKLMNLIAVKLENTEDEDEEDEDDDDEFGLLNREAEEDEVLLLLDRALSESPENEFDEENPRPQETTQRVEFGAAAWYDDF